jgi:hypothetical protein
LAGFFVVFIVFFVPKSCVNRWLMSLNVVAFCLPNRDRYSTKWVLGIRIVAGFANATFWVFSS